MYMELEFADKVSLKELNLSVKDVKEDLELLRKWGFEYNKHIIKYLHEEAERTRECIKAIEDGKWEIRKEIENE